MVPKLRGSEVSGLRGRYVKSLRKNMVSDGILDKFMKICAMLLLTRRFANKTKYAGVEPDERGPQKTFF
jgi:hypothetical protein